MKPWLVDVPVVVYLWIRPQLQKKTFACIRKARPSTLFLISDGGRNDAEWEKIYESRRIVESMIDWDCTVYKLYETVNNGMYAIGRKTYPFIWTKVDRLIYFEDDTMADPTYFRFCAELLERYKDDLRVQGISGKQPFGVFSGTPYDYLFSDIELMETGGAIWKRSWEIYDTTDWLEDPYLRKNIEMMSPTIHITFGQLDRDGTYAGHIPGSEFYYGLQKLLDHQLCIIPAKNMVRQMGATDDGAHAVALHKLDKKSQQMYTIKLYPCEFPIKHPPHVIIDMVYKKARLKQIPGTVEQMRRRLVTLCKRLYYGDGKLLAEKFVKRFIIREKQKEK